jgi:hypothetical protein
MEAKDLLDAAPSWPCPFSAYEALLLDPALLRPEPCPAPPSISRRRTYTGGKRGGLWSATALIRGGGWRFPGIEEELAGDGGGRKGRAAEDGRGGRGVRVNFLSFLKK